MKMNKARKKTKKIKIKTIKLYKILFLKHHNNYGIDLKK